MYTDSCLNKANRIHTVTGKLQHLIYSKKSTPLTVRFARVVNLTAAGAELFHMPIFTCLFAKNLRLQYIKNSVFLCVKFLVFLFGIFL